MFQMAWEACYIYHFWLQSVHEISHSSFFSQLNGICSVSQTARLQGNSTLVISGAPSSLQETVKHQGFKQCQRAESKSLDLLTGVAGSSGCCNKIPQTRWLKEHSSLSHSSRGWESRCWKLQCLVRVLFLVCRWPRSHCVLTWHGVKGWRALIASSFYMGSTLMTSSRPDYLPPITTPSHWG